ncbi:MAG: FGGY family carbohydrate kinase [Gammaproteobacteria bacterium]|nr:FGGY family carbohydrate kinase [Gammaproteobacteria bacterium]
MPGRCRAIGITNQRETSILWDRRTGEPVYPAIVWQDRRTAGQCQQLRAAGQEAWVRTVTGLLLDPYFSGTKIAWMLDQVDGVRERAERGELAFGTVDTWLVWQLTGGRVHVTDATNASRTLLWDLRRGCWSDEMLAMLDVPRSLLPEVVDSAGVVAETDPGPVRCSDPDRRDRRRPAVAPWSARPVSRPVSRRAPTGPAASP